MTDKNETLMAGLRYRLGKASGGQAIVDEEDLAAVIDIVDKAGPLIETLASELRAVHAPTNGMSFRDTAALAALPAIIAATSAGQHMVSLQDGEEVTDAIARDAYAMADAMLAARAKPSPLPLGTESGGR